MHPNYLISLKCLLLIYFIFFYSLGFSQNKYTISGYVTDAETNEILIGASVIEKTNNTGVISDATGFYSLNLNEGRYEVAFTYLGFETKQTKVNLNQNTRLDISLASQKKELEEVVVTGETFEEKLDNTQMSSEKISIQELKNIPIIFGELDIIKALQLKPGVKSAGEGSSGFYVRGGGPDQNLVLLDEAIVYNASHLFGFFSVFNPDAIKEVELYKGDFPAQFGGRLSSVLSVKLREGNKQKFSGTGGIGLISSRLSLEAPIQKGKSSFIISGRRTYFDVFTRLINKANEGAANYNPIPDYFFYDLNMKADYILGAKDKIYLSAYYGRDVFAFKNKNFNFDFNWGNTTATLRWNHVFNKKLFSNVTAYYSAYQYEIVNRFDIFRFSLSSNIQDYTGKIDFDFQPNEKHYIRFGGAYTYHQFLIGRLDANSDDGSVNFGSQTRLAAHEMAAYFTDDITLSNRWKVTIGARLSGFDNGAGEFYTGFEPRISARYKVNDQVSLKASLARMYQYIHLVSNSGASLPTDIWYPSNKIVMPQISDQAALGASFLLFGGKYLLTNEYYYKEMQNQLDLKDGAQIFANPQLDQEFVFGRGWSYGTELYLEKKQGRFTGWIGYTLSWTFRQFGESNGNRAINSGNVFYPRYDRRHDASVVLIYKLNQKLTLSATWVYNTGNATSLPTGRFFVQNVSGGQAGVIPVFTERNGYRLPDYHRLDLGLVWKLKTRKSWESDLTFSVYNVYNRRNPYFIYFEELKDTNGNTTGFQGKQVALFPVIPTITYNFKF